MTLHQVTRMAVFLFSGLCLAASPAISNQGRIILSFSPSQQILTPPQGPIQPGEAFQFYILGEFPGDVSAWEAGVTVPAHIQIQSRTLAHSLAFNLADATQDDWVVGISGCLQPPPGLFVLVTYDAVLLSDQGPTGITLTSSPLESAGPGLTAWVGCNATAPTIAGYDASGDSITVNPDLTALQDVPFGRLQLLPAVPNPFNPQTELRFRLPVREDAHLRIHDAAGRLVRDFHLGNLEAGLHKVAWNGTDADGRRVASGLYLVSLQASQGSASQRITLLK